MLGKVKQLNELRKLQSQAKSLQRELEQIKETVEYGDIKVTVSGDQKIIALTLGEEEVQKKAAKKMMEMGGGLGGLLGKM